MNFNGSVKDIRGKSVKCEAVMIMKEETKENFLKQFEGTGIKVSEATLEDCDDPETKFYLVSLD